MQISNDVGKKKGRLLVEAALAFQIPPCRRRSQTLGDPALR